jgi:UDP-3-O-[3-hydroxymyristoyl] glucosamine N-acyltransferase
VRASPKKRPRKARSSARERERDDDETRPEARDGSGERGPGVSFEAPVTLAALASAFGGEVDPGAGDLEIARVAPIDTAGSGDLAPLVARRYLRAALRSEAALLVDPALAAKIPAGRRWIHPLAAFALALVLKRIEGARRVKRRTKEDRRGLAHIEPGADVDPTAVVGPGAVILAGAAVGPGARIEPNAVIYGGAVIEARAVIGAGSVVGRPGFGWTPSPEGELVRIPQLGGVLIEADAELGPLCTVDAGTLGPTVVGRGAKLDAHVHVGHNAVIGPGAVVAAQAGFAGSVRVGAGALVGGQAGVSDHVEIGAGAKLAAKAGVIGDVPPGAVVGGYPAVDRARWLKAVARMLRADADSKNKRTPIRGSMGSANSTDSADPIDTNTNTDKTQKIPGGSLD